MNLDRLSTPQKVTAGAMAVVFISAFLPWASLFGVSAIGVQGDGVITLIFAIAGLALLILTTGVFGTEPKFAGRGAEIASIVLGGLTALVGLIDMSGIASIGLYLTLLGGLAWAGCAIWQLTLTSQSAQAAPTQNPYGNPHQPNYPNQPNQPNYPNPPNNPQNGPGDQGGQPGAY